MSEPDPRQSRPHSPISSGPASNAPALQHQVFLSHTGQNPGSRDFAAALHKALQHYSIPNFYDVRSIDSGTQWRQEIRGAAASCTVFVAVLCKEYFERRWCLLELQQAAANRRAAGRQGRPFTILPVWYDLQHDEVKACMQRWSTVWAALEADSAHRPAEERINAAALQQLVHHALDNTQGILRTNVSKAETTEQLLADVVDNVRHLVPAVPFPGMDNYVELPLDWLWDSQQQMVGLYGMGGMGKTTLAKAACNAFVQRTAGMPLTCLVDFELGCSVQQAMLQVKLQAVCKQLQLPYDGSDHQLRQRIVAKLQESPVLLVLDNIADNNASSIAEAFLGDQSSGFHPATRVLLTSRSMSALSKAGCSPAGGGMQAMRVMGHDQAKRLLKSVLAKREQPLPAPLVSQALADLQFCHPGSGELQFVPLAIKAVAEALRACQDCTDAEHILARFHNGDDAEGAVMATLRTSFDLLDDFSQHVFLDLAVSLPKRISSRSAVGWQARHIVDWLAKVHYDELGSSKVEEMQQTVQMLHQRSLIRMSKDGHVRVHDLYKKLAEDIVAEQHQRFLHHPLQSKSSKAWLQPQPGAQRVVLVDVEEDSLHHHQLAQCSGTMAAKFHRFRCTSLPRDCLCGPQPWQLLRSLNVRDCDRITELPDLSGLTQLRYLVVTVCARLKRLPDLSALTQLQYLAISTCSELEDLPPAHWPSLHTVIVDRYNGSLGRLLGAFDKLTSLQQLTLSVCCQLTELPLSVSSLVQLQTLSVLSCPLLHLPDSITQLQMLQHVFLKHCDHLLPLAEPVELFLGRCSARTGADTGKHYKALAYLRQQAALMGAEYPEKAFIDPSMAEVKKHLLECRQLAYAICKDFTTLFHAIVADADRVPTGSTNCGSYSTEEIDEQDLVRGIMRRLQSWFTPFAAAHEEPSSPTAGVVAHIHIVHVNRAKLSYACKFWQSHPNLVAWVRDWRMLAEQVCIADWYHKGNHIDEIGKPGQHYADGITNALHDDNGRRPWYFKELQQLEKAASGTQPASSLYKAHYYKQLLGNTKKLADLPVIKQNRRYTT